MDAVINTEEAQGRIPGRAGQANDWYPGMASPNADGRPPKERSLTAILEAKIDKEKLADELWAIASGESEDSTAMRLEAIKYIYARIEGNPLQAMRHSSDGSIVPLIFLHPGMDAPAPKVEQPAEANAELDIADADAIEAEATEVPETAH